jgi:hypothetical protein
MNWLRRILGLDRVAYVPAPSGEPPHEVWVEALLEELRTPAAEQEFARLDSDPLTAQMRQMRARYPRYVEEHGE